MEKTHLDAIENQNKGAQRMPKDHNCFPFLLLYSCFWLDPAGSAASQTMRWICNTTSPVILTLPSPSVTYLNAFFTLLFSGRAATRRLTALPALPFWPRQLGSGRIVAGDALCVPLRVRAAMWGGLKRKEERWNFRGIETDCKMYDGEGEAHYESFIFGCEAADAEMRVYRKTYFIKWQSHTLITGTYLIFLWPWPQPKYSSINVLHKERQDGDFKRTWDKRKIKASYQGQECELERVIRMLTGNRLVPQEKVPDS